MVQIIDCKQTERVETGAVQFHYENGNEDWNGYFLRGDSAMNVAIQINIVERALGLLAGGLPKEEFLNLVWLPMSEISSLKHGILDDTVVGMDTTSLKEGSNWHK